MANSSCGNEKLQSPININPKAVNVSSLKLDLIIPKRVQLTNFELLNTGKTIQVSPVESDPMPWIKFNGQVYHFGKLHFHWSNDKKRGSEHSINKTYGSLELHMVYFNRKYENITIATQSKKQNGLLVVAVLYDEVVNETLSNDWLKPVQNVSVINTQQVINGSFLFNLTPVSTFYHYNGSLTTPLCDEVVQWIVMTKKQPISESIMKMFRNVTDLNEKSESYLPDKRYRPLQKVAGRQVLKSKNVIKIIQSSSSVASVSLLSIFLPFMAYFINY